MRLLKTELFKTVHPMTYMFVFKSMLWGLLIILDATSPLVNLLTKHDMLWPIPLTFVWAGGLILVGLLTIFFFLRDHCDRSKKRIQIISTINMSLWIFAGTFWFITTGSQIMIVISIFNVLGAIYVALASRFSRADHRV